jgi:hypothetical protein
MGCGFRPIVATFRSCVRLQSKTNEAMLRGAEQWLWSYLTRERHAKRISPEQPLHACIAVCDHFEPLHHTDKAGALRAIADWQEAWPQRVETYQDSSGRGPRHSFFYPVEQYDSDLIAPLADICQQTGSEVEIHLHHDNDTEEGVTKLLLDGVRDLSSHGLLSRDPGGRPRYAFIHGNWALDNSRPDGRWCGVSNELTVLKRTGCYADLTLPSAPDPCQTRTLNSVYYAKEDGCAKSHDHGTPVQAGKTAALREKEDHLLLVQGPLGLNWKWRKWGFLPRLENGDLTGANPPTIMRTHLWLELCPRVKDGAPWVFIKLHTHAGIPKNYRALLGDPGKRFYEGLSALTRSLPGFHYHFVTAREMVNLIHAAEDGHTGTPKEWLNYRYAPPPILAHKPQ